MPTNKTTNKKRRTTTSTNSRSAIDTKVKVTVSLTADAAQQLEQITKQFGLSKSELFERISKGELVVGSEGQETAIAIHPGTEETVNLKPSADGGEAAVQPQEEDTQLKQQLEEQTHQIQALQQQVARISELESQLAKTVPAETHETLKQQAEQQKQTITDLENQLARLGQLEQRLAQTIDQETYNALQQESEQQKSRLAELEQKLATTIPADTHQALQQELEQQKSTISALQHQLEENNQTLAQLDNQQAKIAELEAKIAHSVSPESYHALENLAATQKLQLAQLQQKLTDLVPQKSEHHNSPVATVGYDALKQYLEEQENMISGLQKQVIELQGLASIGESQLSKWRNRSFNR